LQVRGLLELLVVIDRNALVVKIQAQPPTCGLKNREFTPLITTPSTHENSALVRTENRDLQLCQEIGNAGACRR
jgi:hypothetical protein